MMKISSSTFKTVESKEWAIPDVSETFQMILHHNERALQWERTLRVGLSLGCEGTDDAECNNEVISIIQAVRQMGKRSFAGRSDETRLLKRARNETYGVHLPLSVSQAFSLTSPSAKSKSTNRRLGEENMREGRDWRRSLQNGLEADHSCSTMFDLMEVKIDTYMKQFNIILNPHMEYEKMNDFEMSESSASNVDCVKSLIIGLSIHPHVLSVSAEIPVTPDDFESQWITQSNSWGSTPLYDRGL